MVKVKVGAKIRMPATEPEHTLGLDDAGEHLELVAKIPGVSMDMVELDVMPTQLALRDTTGTYDLLLRLPQRVDHHKVAATFKKKKQQLRWRWKHKKLLAKIKDRGVGDDTKIEELLDVADDGIGERLKQFEGEQAIGEKLNELTEKYYKQYPRKWEDPWPLPANRKTDAVLREILTDFVLSPPNQIKKVAVERLGIELS